MSPNGTRIGPPSTPSLNDSQGVKWSISPGGVVLRNNILTNGKATEVLLFNNNIYAKSPTGGYWWQWKGNNTWQKLTLADPSASIPLPPAPAPTGVVLSFAPYGSAVLSEAQLHSKVGDSAFYRKPLAGNHLVAWFEVRGNDVLAWLENGYLNVPGPTSYAGTLKLTIDGTDRASYTIDLPSHCRAPFWPQRISGGEASLVAASVILPFVPKYVTTTAESLLAALPQVYTPLMQAGFPGAMGTAGYHPSIGLLPQWDAAYLTSSDPRALRSVVLHALAAGRYAIHYRDEKTNEPLKFADWPNLSADASTINQLPAPATGTSAPGWKNSHHPSIGYLAYLLTGWRYFADEVRFAAAYLYLSQVDWMREFSNGILKTDAGTNTTRGTAWGLRTLMHAAIVSESGSQYVQVLQNNLDYYHKTYIITAGGNPQGFTKPYGDYTGPGDGKYWNSIWMEDFLTAVFGWALDVFPSTKAAEFFAWKARSIIGRLGPIDEYDYRDAAQYIIAVAPTDSLDWTGPWFASWREVYLATLGTKYAGVPGTALRGDSGAAPVGADGYWANLLPALSYAVKHKVIGADAAWGRLSAASNFQGIIQAFPSAPEWAITPAAVTAPAPAPSPSPAPVPAPPPSGGSLPAWVTALPLWRWYEIPNTALSSVDPVPKPLGNIGPKGKIEAWCGATLKRKGSVYMLGAAGGHSDYAGNEVDALALNTEVPAWKQLRAPSANEAIINGAQFYLDKRPSATHTYYATQFIDSLDRMMVYALAGVAGPFPPAPPDWPYMGWQRSFSFNVATGDWDDPDYVAKFVESRGDNTACLCVKHQYTDDVYMSQNYAGGFYKWVAKDNAWIKLPGESHNPWYSGSAMDPTRNRIFYFGGYTPYGAGMLDGDGNGLPDRLSGLTDDLVVSGYPGAIYDEANDTFLAAFNSDIGVQIRRVGAGSLFVDIPPITGSLPPRRVNGILNSIQYVPELKGVVIATKHDGNVHFMRTA